MAVLLPSHRLFYGAVPKAACTSIKYMFFEFENGVPFAKFRVNGKVRHIHTAAYPTLMRGKYPEAAIAGFHRVAVLRDPVERLLSAYGNRVVKHRGLRSKLGRKTTLPDGLDPAPDLGAFIDNLEAYTRHSRMIEHHVRPMVDFLGDDPDYFAQLYPMGKLDDFVRDMSERLGAELRLGRHQTGGPRFSRDQLDARRRARLEDFYRADYRAFGRYF